MQTPFPPLPPCQLISVPAHCVDSISVSHAWFVGRCQRDSVDTSWLCVASIRLPEWALQAASSAICICHSLFSPTLLTPLCLPRRFGRSLISLTSRPTPRLFVSSLCLHRTQIPVTSYFADSSAENRSLSLYSPPTSEVVAKKGLWWSSKAKT